MPESGPPTSATTSPTSATMSPRNGTAAPTNANRSLTHATRPQTTPTSAVGWTEGAKEARAQTRPRPRWEFLATCDRAFPPLGLQ
jgi:hypothetical protein